MKPESPMSMRAVRGIVVEIARIARVAVLGFTVAAAVAGCGNGDDWHVDTNPDGEVRAYNLDFAVQSAGTFGALQLEVSHLGQSGGFIGNGDTVACTALVEAFVASNFAGERVLKVALISLEGIRTPSTILRCGFRTSEELTPADFAVDVRDASDTESKPLDPVPTVIISSISRR
jgi:hypothetical protein